MKDEGYPIRYVFSDKEYSEVLTHLHHELGMISVVNPAECHNA